MCRWARYFDEQASLSLHILPCPFPWKPQEHLLPIVPPHFLRLLTHPGSSPCGPAGMAAPSSGNLEYKLSFQWRLSPDLLASP